MTNIPSGNVTFLFTDIEGSTMLVQKYFDTHHTILKRHNSILTNAIESNNGFIFKTVGDGYCVSFENEVDAVTTAVEIQKNLLKEDWGKSQIKVRIGIHTGKAEYFENDYIGYFTLARTQRIMSVANGGQILISGAVHKNLEKLSTDFNIRDLGERRLKDLIRQEHIYQVSSKDIQSDFPQLRTLDIRPNNLPVQLTSYIGREKEMYEIKKLLSKTRLLTLIGTGGTGKTRLSIKAGTDLIDEFANGVWFVELASVSSPSFIEKEIAAVLKLTSDGNIKTINLISDFLKEREVLLILDNCEHLIKECAYISDILLSLCPKLKILASSREPLRIKGEVSFQVPSLSLPDLKETATVESVTQFEAVRLFIDRALLVNHKFEITNSNAPYVAELCHRLDGIPLAIELASARTGVLSVENILKKINDRFNILTSLNRSAMPRQQTLKAMIDWSYDLLSEKEKLLFIRLSVFSGGWTLEAAEEVCSDDTLDQSDILDLLSNLIDKSLVVSKESEGNFRFNMLETIRQYGNEKLTEKTKIQENHYQYFLKLCLDKSSLQKTDKINILRKIKSEQENLRSAINWSMENNPELAIRLVNEMGEVWELNGNFSEGLSIYKRIFEINLKFDEEVKAAAFLVAGFLASQLGEYENSQNYLNQSLELSKKLDKKVLIAESLNNLGNLLFIKNEMKEAQKCHEEALQIGTDINDKLTISTSLINLASVYSFYRDYENAIIKYEKGLSLMRELNDIHMVARILPQLAFSFTKTGNIEKSRLYYEESLPVLKEYDDHIPLAISILHLGDISLSQSRYDEAELYYEECLSMTKEFGYKYIYLYALINMGNLKLRTDNDLKAKEFYSECLKMCDIEADKHKLAVCFLGIGNYYYKNKNYDVSAKAFGISERFFEDLGLKLPEGKDESTINKFTELKNILSEDRFNEWFQEGKSLSADESVNYFLEL